MDLARPSLMKMMRIVHRLQPETHDILYEVLLGTMSIWKDDQVKKWIEKMDLLWNKVQDDLDRFER